VKDVTYAVDLWWLTGNSLRSVQGVTFQSAVVELEELRANPAVARAEIVKCIRVETPVRRWSKRKPKGGQ
jgi:hypothetical protein